MNARRLFARSALALALSATAVPAVVFASTAALAASEVKVVVNHDPITSFEIRQREAFLKLRRTKGNLAEAATDELIDEALKKQQIRRYGINVPDEAVNQSYAKFASQNKLTQAQLQQVLSRAGFSEKAFKDYIKVQMGWGQAVQMHLRQADKLSQQDVVQRMLANGGEKPTTTEYTLQQVIFVIPGDKKSMVPERTREANALRARFQSCPSTYEFAKGLRDVTVRDLGRVAQPQLPSLWKDDIERLSVNQTTPAKTTDKGVEFIAVCNAQKVSDDVAAAMVFQAQDMKKLGGDEPDKAYLKDLRSKAKIVRK